MELFLNEEDKKECFKVFEDEMENLKHSHCLVCRRVTLTVAMAGKGKGVCVQCDNAGRKEDYYLKRNALPIWYDDDGKPQFHLPKVLSDLTLGEKMLISRVSPLVALHHLKNGTFGLQGHCCAFPQDIDGFVNELPRKPDDVNVLRVLRAVQQEIGSSQAETKPFLIRRKAILDALKFLIAKNSEYKQYCTIDESQLDWMEGDEDELPTVIQEVQDFYTAQDTTLKDDAGPNMEQSLRFRMESENIGAYGVLSPDEKMELQKDDEVINATLQSVLKEKKISEPIFWPKPSEKPVNEFKFDGKLFVQAFPWLFPGGCGDVTDYPHRQLGGWGNMLLLYEDGRFAKDDIFCFYAMNYLVRHRNASSGHFFVKNFYNGGPVSLGELQEKILQGDTAWVNNITYWTSNVKGSSAFWHKHRAQLYSWMQYHVEMGHGAPTFFMTLSCAEYFWPDIVRLLKERLELAGQDPSVVDGKNFVQLCNDYSIVIQEYFQKRVITWLETVGKEVFGIKHYWLRYEFAPNRGQIHAHLLAISSDNPLLYEAAHNAYKTENGDMKRAQVLATWAENRFGLTATVSDDFDSIEIGKNDIDHPCRIRFKDIMNDDRMKANDAERLKKAVMMHDCSQFCMKIKNKGTQCMDCKSGAGREKTPGKCDTPGFPLSDDPEVKRDRKGSKKLLLPRNNPRLSQASIDMLQSWRGNCDVQILIYDSSPNSPALEEIAVVTDYVVAYSSKGNKTLREEREQNMLLIAR